MLPLSLSYDHRVIDGAAAARFVAHLVSVLIGPAPGAAVSDVEVRVPDIGDFADVPVIEILVAAGRRRRREDPLVTLESDKATMDVPAPAAGTITQLRVAIGDRVSEGSVLLTLEADGAGPESEPRGASDAEPGRRRRARARRRPHRRPRPPARPTATPRWSSSAPGPGGYTAAFRAADLGLKRPSSSATSASAASA